MYAIRPGTLIETYSPSAVVAQGRWIGANGNQVTQRGVRAHAVAFEDFSASDVAARNGVPPKRLAGIRFGFAEVVLGDTVADNALVTCAADGRTITAAGSDEVLGFLQIGGSAGERREIIVLLNHDSRLPSAAIPNLNPGTATAADCATTINLILAAQRQKNTILAA